MTLHAPSHATFSSCWIPSFLCPCHGVKREPIKRLRKIRAILFKGKWDLWDEIIELQIEKYILRELLPQMPISFVIDLCGGGWGNLIPLPSLPHPYCFRVSVPNCTTQPSSPRLVLRKVPHTPQQCSFQRLLSVTFPLPIDSRIILKWKIYPHRQKLGSLILRESVVLHLGYPAAICQPCTVINRQVFTKGHS